MIQVIGKRKKEENPDDAFYRGTVAGLEALNEKIKFVFKEKEEKEQCQTDQIKFTIGTL